MSFIAKKTVKGHTYYSLVQSYRGEGGKPTHRVLKYFGRIRPPDEELFLDEERFIKALNERIAGLDKATKAKILTILGGETNPSKVLQRLKAYASQGNQDFMQLDDFIKATGT